MPTVKDVAFGNGDVTFYSKVDAVPASSETNGNVTINHSGKPEVPARFEVSFMLSVTAEEAGLEFSNVFHLKTLVKEGDSNASYRQVESEAARHLAPMLRSVADKIEQNVAEFDAREEPK